MMEFLVIGVSLLALLGIGAFFVKKTMSKKGCSSCSCGGSSSDKPSCSSGGCSTSSCCSTESKLKDS